MREDSELIISFIQQAFLKQEITDSKYAKLDLKKLDEIASKNSLKPLLLDAVMGLKKNQIIELSDEFVQRWKDTSLFLTLNEYKKYYKLKMIFDEGEKEKVKFIAFKGCVLADLYPKYTLRVSADSDLLVYEKDKQKAIQILEKLNYIKDEEGSKDNVYVYVDSVTKHMVELHFCLWEDFKGEKITLLNQMELDKESSLIQLPVCNMTVTTLGLEQHLIYQMIHIIKHFTLQGIGARYLIDITLYVNRYGHEIDLKDFWNKIDQLGYGEFCEKFFALCNYYFKMSDEILKGRKPRSEKECKLLLYDLIDVGICFVEQKEEWQFLCFMEPYFCGSRNVSRSKLIRKLKLIFPKSDELGDRYRYARKYKFLLPIAWCHRWISSFLIWKKHEKNLYNPKERLEVIEHRLNIIKSLGLTDGSKAV